MLDPAHLRTFGVSCAVVEPLDRGSQMTGGRCRLQVRWCGHCEVSNLFAHLISV